jgi:hypothetical protein
LSFHARTGGGDWWSVSSPTGLLQGRRRDRAVAPARQPSRARRDGERDALAQPAARAAGAGGAATLRCVDASPGPADPRGGPAPAPA